MSLDRIAQSFIDRVEANGGKLRVEGDRLSCANPDAAAPYLNELGECKAEVMRLVRGRSAESASEDVFQALLREHRERRGRQ